MKGFELLLSCLIVTFLINGCISKIESKQMKTDSEKKLHFAVIEAIHLLKSKRYIDFYEKFVEPETKEIFKKHGTVSEFVTQFKKRKAKELLQKLLVIKDKKAQLDHTGKIATFNLPAPPENKHSEYCYISFIKINGDWYLKGH